MNIYVLNCKNNKYYIGKTDDLGKRLQEHFNGSGSSWTSKYHPLGVVEVKKSYNKYDEDKYVLNYMEKYGVENVRGGSYSTIDLTIKQKTYLERQIASANNLCYRCGRKGHFINKCYAKTHADGRQLEPLYCLRCKRTGHTQKNCYAIITKDGFKI